jgi:hypothetical protein
MTAASAALVAALLAQAAIALVLLWMLGAIRVPLVTAGKIKMGDVALSREPWPDDEKKVSNAFDNQFQLPVLFYLSGGLALYLGAGWLEVLLAWLFVLSRVAHATIFVTRNRVSRRFFAYTAGYFVLIAFWLDLAVRLILAVIGGR